MDSEHERFESLAVGHVLGGLAAPAAAEFRGHLLGCRDCRSRVAELRDIAADLVAAEREERAEARVRTEVAREAAQGDAVDDGRDPAGPRLSSVQLAVAAVVLVLAIGALAFWNLHLRAQVSVASGQIERLEGATTGIAGGIPVVIDLAEGTRGVVAVDGEGVAFSFVDLPPVTGSERVTVWLEGAEEGPTVAAIGTEPTLAGRVADRDAAELVVTIEDVETTPTAPGARELVRADLDRPGV